MLTAMRASRVLLIARRDNLYILVTALFPAVFFGSDLGVLAIKHFHE
jgi:hypothetical protein